MSGKIMRLMIKYLRLEIVFLKMNIIAISKYSISYFLSILYELMNGVMNIIYFYVMFGTIDKIAGWERNDIFLLVIIAYFIDVTCVFLFIGTSSIPDYISTGMLDVLLTKPINHQFLLSFRRPNSVQIINVAIAILCMSFEVGRKNFGIVSIVFFGISICISIILMYLTMSSIVFLSFWFIRSGSAWEIIEKLNSVSSKPGDIYPKAFRMFLTFVVPSMIVINYPVEILRFQNYSLLLTRTLPITITMFLVNQIIFKMGIKHYSGAGG